jgi:hypothetical protein
MKSYAVDTDDVFAAGDALQNCELNGLFVCNTDVSDYEL